MLFDTSSRTMADQPQPGAISAAFPAPPPFYKHFTPENLARLQEIQASTSSSAGEPSAEEPAQPPSSIDLDALPLELRYLIPPAPPTGQYRSFNTIEDVRAPSHLHSTPSLTPLAGLPSPARILPTRPTAPQNPDALPPTPLPLTIAHSSHEPGGLSREMG